ncbi:hypothetical protein CJ483_22105 [Bacillus sp. PK3_68]|nr:hypothetical protein CJ483_22105 [Bacillus sp. PK3_68]
MNYFQFDSLSISVIWIAAAAAFFISAAVNRILGDEKVGDWYGNSFFFILLFGNLAISSLT